MVKTHVYINSLETAFAIAKPGIELYIEQGPKKRTVGTLYVDKEGIRWVRRKSRRSGARLTWEQLDDMADKAEK